VALAVCEQRLRAIGRFGFVSYILLDESCAAGRGVTCKVVLAEDHTKQIVRAF
jgi:hypothetical protein